MIINLHTDIWVTPEISKPAQEKADSSSPKVKEITSSKSATSTADSDDTGGAEVQNLENHITRIHSETIPVVCRHSLS